MGLPDFLGLSGFSRAARGQSQEQIIRVFLEMLILKDEVADAGSVLINHPRQKKLVLFNENVFSIRDGHFDAAQDDSWEHHFDYSQGIAGKAFEQSRTIHFARGDQNLGRLGLKFLGQSPIQNMICIPIMTRPGQPLGIVCLHNNDPERRFSDEQIKNIEAFVDVFALALHIPHPELHLEKNVFVVHGHDSNALEELQSILGKHQVQAKVLKEELKNAAHILTALEDLLRECTAGFILATPDDEGRSGKEESRVEPRARENVIFETGLLFAKFRTFDRVAILLKEPLILPSDLHGVYHQRFAGSLGQIEDRIVATLDGWGLISPKTYRIRTEARSLARDDVGGARVLAETGMEGSSTPPE